MRGYRNGQQPLVLFAPHPMPGVWWQWQGEEGRNQLTYIRNPQYMSQVVDFSGMRWGDGMPTDIDAFCEFSNKLFMLFEVKYEGADMPKGQRLALERLVDAVGQVKPAVLIVGEHISDGDAVPLHLCRVVQYRFKGKWSVPVRECSVKVLAEAFLKRFAPERLDEGRNDD